MSRPEALQYREACLKFTVKKADRHLLLDVLREVSVEVESFHSMLEASLISTQLTDLRISEGDQYLLYLRNLPEKVQEFAQLHFGATTVARLWEAVNSYYVRMRMFWRLGQGARGCTTQACSGWRCSVPQLWSQRPLCKRLSKSSEVLTLWKAWACSQRLLGPRTPA